jgi:hypothetical protein
MPCCTVPSPAGWPQRAPHSPQHPARMPTQLARTDPQHGVAELRQEGGALLLALALLSLREQLHDQRALAADVRHDERTDLAVRAEAMRMQ